MAIRLTYTDEDGAEKVVSTDSILIDGNRSMNMDAEILLRGVRARAIGCEITAHNSEVVMAGEDQAAAVELTELQRRHDRLLDAVRAIAAEETSADLARQALSDLDGG